MAHRRQRFDIKPQGGKWVIYNLRAKTNNVVVEDLTEIDAKNFCDALNGGTMSVPEVLKQIEGDKNIFKNRKNRRKP